MYQISKLLLIMALWLAIYAFVVCCIAGGWLGWALLAVVAMAAFKSKGKVFTTLGSGRVAKETEMRRAGMLNGGGLILGWHPRAMLLKRIWAVFRQIPAKAACDQVLGRPELITLPRSTCHVSVYGPTGSGKGSSLILPWLLSPSSSSNDSCVCVDMKGELALITSEARRRMGHRIVILDPFKVVTQ